MSDLSTGIRAALALIPGPKYQKCARLGISLPTYDKWVNGVSEPSEQNMARLARMAGVDQEWVRNGGTEPAEDEINEGI